MTKTFRVLTSLFVAAAFVAHGAQAATANVFLDFESPTYSSGTVVGQDSWAGGTAPRVLTAAEITNELTAAGLNGADPVRSGNQALFATSQGGSSSTVRPVTGLSSGNIGILDVWARALSPGAAGSTVGVNAGNIFFTMEDSTGARAAAVRFGATLNEGQLDTTSIDAYSGAIANWIPTGETWLPDTWYNLRLVADYTAKTYDVLVDGALVESDVPFYSAASSSLAQIRVFRGSNQAGMIVDDLSVSVVPEPATAALAAFGLLAIALRKRG